MKVLRPLLLALCCVLPGLHLGVAWATEPAVKVQGKVLAKPVTKPAAKPVTKAPAKPQSKPHAKARAKVSKAVAKPLPAAKLDLSLPKSMVNTLEPEVGDAPMVRKPLLPSMFPSKPESDDSPFQLNGRLISNEMQLQLRNDSRREVDGAAIDFQFRN
ncbi:MULTISPECIES: hypothetical protein [Pseudomonas]|jgi:hypothetical protein|uniref:Translation initiation factor 2 n=1 Tax=Pseudomonas mosselii TaxID=78327 RepID=A0A5R8Z1V9_9PSED|nr:hypothetical protein [Pseudomonas mosselii]TLP59127.1 hypothetical protein FEM01_14605 [Pseudomonas mosselii]